MAIPEQFSESEFLQDLFRRYANPLVRDFFSDLGGADWDPDITTPRGSIRYGCTHKDDDSLAMTLLRWQLFEHVRKLKFDVPHYGIPVSSFQESRRFRPQIMLYFQEDLADAASGYSPISGEISFRLMNHDSSSLTPTVAQTYANRIRSNFGAGGGYIWRKGRTMVSYTDWSRGYQLQLLCRSASEGRQLITHVLDIQNDTPNWKYCNVSENEESGTAYPPVPPLETVYGRSRRLPRRRPVGDVRFQYATLNVQGLQNPVVLYDRSGVWPLALVD